MPRAADGVGEVVDLAHARHERPQLYCRIFATTMPAEIVIVDDDPVVGNLTTDILRDAGFTTLWVKDCFQAEHVIRATQPRLAVLDIMMPGLDGLSLLKTLKGDPSTAAIKCIVVSGKSFETDKSRALSQGADLFLEKPFDIDAFQKEVSRLIGKPVQPQAKSAQPAVSKAVVRVWGSRAPSENAGGPPTVCLSIETPERVFAFDAGTGLSKLGAELVERAPQKDLWVLLTHAHTGHLEGLKDFPPASLNRGLKVCGPTTPDEPLKEVVRGALAKARSRPQARIELYELVEESYELAPGIRLGAMYANHPGTTLALSLELDGKKFVYAADGEAAGEAAGAMQDYDEKLAKFARGADLLVHDAQFTEQDHRPRSGHSHVGAALAVAEAAGARELWLFHLNPEYGDDKLSEVEADASARAEKAGFRCRLAREGLSQDF